MAKKSAGLLMYRRRSRALEVFLVHPGGPFFRSKDDGVWSIPKGEYDHPEDVLEAAKREFQEETGFEAAGTFQPLTPIRQRSGKVVEAWAFEGDCDPDRVRSNRFTMEWPPESGIRASFPEVDRAGWFGLDEARMKIAPSQVPLLDELQRLVR